MSTLYRWSLKLDDEVRLLWNQVICRVGMVRKGNENENESQVCGGGLKPWTLGAIALKRVKAVRCGVASLCRFLPKISATAFIH